MSELFSFLNEKAKRHPKYGEKSNCAKCNAEIVFTIPKQVNDIFALTTDHTECGEEYRQAIFLCDITDEGIKGV